MFIKTNDRLVSLKNVSNINVLEKEMRIVFNLNYPIEIDKRGEIRFISDYVYLDTRNEEDFVAALKELADNQYVTDNYLLHPKGYININEISSVKFAEKKTRVIFNLSHQVTYTDYNRVSHITSEFVYVDLNSYGEYKTYAQHVKNTLLNKGK